jgi:hypothetical protein
MLKKLVSIVVALAALLAFASPAFAQQGAPTTYYVDTAYTGTETGTPSQPYNTLEEAITAGQAQPYGAYIYTKGAEGNWVYYGYIAPVNPGDDGVALSSPALFGLLGLLSLGLVAGGWFLMRRSRTRALAV